jgi:hypothetical protein
VQIATRPETDNKHKWGEHTSLISNLKEVKDLTLIGSTNRMFTGIRWADCLNPSIGSLKSLHIKTFLDFPLNLITFPFLRRLELDTEEHGLELTDTMVSIIEKNTTSHLKIEKEFPIDLAKAFSCRSQ